SAVFQCDIHPAAKIGRGVFLDHATGLVVGETAVIEDDVSMLHDVTLGGTGKQWEDRHPKIRYGVMIGAGAKILGNIEVGPCARIAAGSVVLRSVPPKTTVAGVPAKVIGEAGCPEPSRSMDHIFPDARLSSQITDLRFARIGPTCHGAAGQLGRRSSWTSKRFESSMSISSGCLATPKCVSYRGRRKMIPPKFISVTNSSACCLSTMKMMSVHI